MAFPTHPWLHRIPAFAALFIFLMLFSGPVSAQERTVRVGVYENPPKLIHDIAGDQPGGILGELFTAIADAEQWDVQAVPCLWQECLEKLENGELDVLPDVAYTTGRDQQLDFHAVPSLHSWSQLYARTAGLASIADLHGLTIAVLRNSVQYDYLENLLAGFGVDARLLEVDELENAFTMVARGTVDAVAANHFFGEAHAKRHRLMPTPIVFQPVSLFYATAEGANADLLESIDRHLAAWQNDPDSPYFATLKKWQNVTLGHHTPAWLWWLLTGLGALLALAVLLAALLRFQVRRQTRHIRAGEHRLNTILDSVEAQIYIKDRHLNYLYVNRKVAEFIGAGASEIIGKSTSQVFGKQPNDDLIQNDLRVLKWGERIAAEENVVSPLTGKVHVLFSVKIPLRNDEGDIEALCGISTDITEHKAAQATAHKLAYYDPLTDLPNRRYVLDRIRETGSAVKKGQTLGAVLLIGMDKFKRINEARGHATGDIILRSVADRLKQAVRPYDTVARVSGDEFAVVLENLKGSPPIAASDVRKIAGKLRLSLENPFVVDRQPYVLTGSVGVTLVLPDDKTADEILREADTAMHRAKEAGANRIAFFEAAMQRDTEERLMLEHQLSHAIGAPELELHLQPQYDQQHATVGAELLLRWNHPVHGLIPPTKYIPLAEESNRIVRIGDWTLQQTCLTLTRLRDAGIHHPLSVNLSPHHFQQPDFVNRVKEILSETGAPADRLVFEVTEGVLIQDLQGTAERMHELTAMGVRFSVDDFGTGYSNLTYLKRLPLFELKIDKTFVHDALDDPDDAAIITLILAMARQLNLHVVAEGVETEQQMAFLSRHGCDAMQGFYFARPMPIDDWIARQGQTGNPPASPNHH